MTSRFEIFGLNAVLGQFDELSKELEKEIGEAVQETTLEIAYDAKRDAAVDLGTLQQSINAGYNASKLEGTVNVNAPHGPYIEFGTGGLVDIPEGFEEMASQFKGSGKRQINLPARPFLIPAAYVGIKNLETKLLRIIK